MENKIYGNSKRFTVINIIILFLIAFVMIYPFINIFSISLSSPEAVINREVILYPKGLNLEAYKWAIRSSDLLNAYKNTLTFTVLGVIVTLFVASITAYPLVRKKLRGRKLINVLIVITMFIPTGLISNFLVVKELGLIDTVWAIVLPPAFMGFNIILMRSSFSRIPESLIEAAYIDGASEWRILLQIVIPLSKATFLVVGLFVAIFQWNYFIGPLLYINNPDMYPLTLLLRKVLLQSGYNPELHFAVAMSETDEATVNMLMPGFLRSFKMAVTMLSIAPIMLLYPFVQKYFIKGATLGAIKE